MLVSLLLFAACGAPAPTIDLMQPQTGGDGVEVKIVGDNFAQGSTATLGGVALESVNVRGVTLIEAVVPAGLSPGPHPLVVTGPDGSSVTVAGAFELVAALRDDVPCGGEYTSYSAIATDSGKIKLDRYFPKEDNRREIIELPIRDVKAIEYEARLQDDGTLCSVIFVKMEDGNRYMFDDDTKVDLKKRAQDMAVGLGKRIQVVHEDSLPKEE